MKHPAHVAVPLASVVTTTSPAPGLTAAGTVPVISVGLTTRRSPSGSPLMVTPVTSTKPVPVMVTCVPPVTRPSAGLTAVTVTSVRGLVVSPQLRAAVAMARRPASARVRVGAETISRPSIRLAKRSSVVCLPLVQDTQIGHDEASGEHSYSG